MKFIIEGDSESGNYSVFVNGSTIPLKEIRGRHRGGLKASRQFIGQYLNELGHGAEEVFSHQCVKPGRDNNPWFHDVTVQEYLDGIDPQKRKVNLVTDFEPGDVVDNTKLQDVFKCSGQGGMRRGKRTNSLVIVSNHVKSLYGDRWEGEVLHYIGMGRKGDQSFDYMQNKTLYESDSNGVEVHLFEVFKEKEYTYQGQVKLVEQPYMQNEADDDGRTRKVCVFPVSVVSEEHARVDEETLERLEEKARKKAARMSQNELLEKASSSKGRPGYRKTEVTHHQRNPYVIEYAKKWANGVCQLCEQPAPFESKDGTPYLETHHIEWLARGGEDTVENTVALCPNCHKKMHVLDDRVDVSNLQQKVSEHLA